MKLVFPFLLNPLCGLLALTLSYLIARILFGEGAKALGAILILATTPIFLLPAYRDHFLLLNLVFFLASLYFLLSALKKGGRADYLLFGIAGGCFLWMRPGNAVYLAGLLIFFLIERKRVNLRLFFLSLILILILGGGFLAYRQIPSGNLFSQFGLSGTAPAGMLSPENSSIREWLRFHPKNWVLHLKLCPLSLSVGFPLLLLALAGFFIPDPSDTQIRFSRFYLCLFILAIVFFANFIPFRGAGGELTLRSSYLRHLIPVISLLPLFVIRLISRLEFPRGRVLVILISFNLLIAVIAPGGIMAPAIRSDHYPPGGSFPVEETEPGDEDQLPRIIIVPEEK